MADQRSPELVEAISAILVQQPFFAVLMCDLMTIHESEHVVTSPDRPNPTAYTDGLRLVFNPKFFKKLTVKERIFVIAHEVCHVIFQHPQRMRMYADLGYGPDLNTFKPGKFNRAADYIINAYLNEINVGEQPIDTLLNGQISSADLVDEVYLKLPDEPEDQNNGWDHHELAADPSQLPDKGTIQRAVAAAAGAQKAAGKMPAGLQRLVDEILEPQVNWAQYLRSTITTFAGNNEQTWCRPNRRRIAVAPHVYLPGRAGTRSEKCSLEIDTSGSISDHELQVFLSECHGIMSDVQPEKLYVGFVDYRLHNDEIIEIEDVNEVLDLKNKAGGGGGTDMTIMHQELEKRDIRVAYEIILTDGVCDFGQDTGVPTIWCITSPSIVAPWGVTVHVKIPEQK
jgi:predicted metal-dependent peptidase